MNPGCAFLVGARYIVPLFDAAVRELRNAKPQGCSEPGLILIKRAEQTSSKSQGGSDVLDVQSASSEEPGLGSGNPPGMCERGSGKGHDADHPCADIPGKGGQETQGVPLSRSV